MTGFDYLHLFYLAESHKNHCIFDLSCTVSTVTRLYEPKDGIVINNLEAIFWGMVGFIGGLQK